jgi:hypothetical protein
MDGSTEIMHIAVSGVTNNDEEEYTKACKILFLVWMFSLCFSYCGHNEIISAAMGMEFPFGRLGFACFWNMFFVAHTEVLY